MSNDFSSVDELLNWVCFLPLAILIRPFFLASKSKYKWWYFALAIIVAFIGTVFFERV